MNAQVDRQPNQHANPSVAPYGAWPSPLGIEELLSAGVGLRTVLADGDDVHWLETLPDEDGRSTLVRHRGDTTTELTPTPINVRCRVHEYGGGSYDVCEGWVVYVDDFTRAVHVLDPQHRRRPITPEGVRDVHYAGVRIHPRLGLVTAVREDYRGEGEAITTVVAIDLHAEQPSEGQVIGEGADFYANVEVDDASGTLAWIEWNHPNMPWDSTRLRVGHLQRDGETVRAVLGADQHGSSYQFATALGPDRVLAFADNGHWVPIVVDEHNQSVELPHLDADHVPPLWVHDNQHAAVLETDRGPELFTAPFVDGRRQLTRVLLTGTSEVELVCAPLSSIDSLAAARGRLWAIAGFDDRPDAVVSIDPLTGVMEVVRSADSEAPEPANVSVARSIWTDTERGPVQAWFYPPQLDGWSAPTGELPPLIVRSHGGPTSMAMPAYNPMIQFWTSRGIAVVDVNYSGSTGFGRDYRNRLRGQWGLADVDDCAAAVRHLCDEGLVDADRVAITGGSAGGYTTLQSLVATDLYSAGVSRYGIGDLEVLASDTHKFEARYPDSLVGPYPADKQVYIDRSPIHHVDQLSTPMLILQGLDDRVVPPNQAESMAAAVRAKNLPVALVMFEGEGHGFRTMAARRRALESELSFLAQLFGFTPADQVPTLAIENLVS